MAVRGFHELRVAAVERLCGDAVAVTFDVPGDLAEAFAFRPGQSLTVRKPGDAADERRSYSICAPAGAPPGGRTGAAGAGRCAAGDRLPAVRPRRDRADRGVQRYRLP